MKQIKIVLQYLFFYGLVALVAFILNTMACSVNRDQTPLPEYRVITPMAKPVIYLYPEKPTAVTVHLELAGELEVTYPDYGNGWSVTAYPDGTLINHADGQEYSYLFWEGTSKTEFDFSQGFVVKGEETASFLREALKELGLTPKEYNEFIVYWYPLMKKNPYNLIAFQFERYTEAAKLQIFPRPDSLLRVFMAYKPLAKPVDIQEQTLPSFTRSGFTVVEWGGTEVK